MQFGHSSEMVAAAVSAGAGGASERAATASSSAAVDAGEAAAYADGTRMGCLQSVQTTFRPAISSLTL